MTDFRYKAFVSYSWSDAEWGKWLLHAIETYRTPKAMIGKAGANGPVPERLHPLFKDREEQAAGASIGAAVEAALATSEFLIVICSPRSAKSQWVNREVAWFKAHRDPGKILALIVDGEPGGDDLECFPKALTHQVLPDLTVSDIPVDTPLAADARISGDGKRKARLKLAAAMLGVGLGELANRDEARRTLRTRIVVGASLALATVMSGMAWYAVQQRNEAEHQRAESDGLVEFMLTDLRERLEPVGRLDALDVVGKRALRYYAEQKASRLDADALGRRARALHLVGEVSNIRGDSAAGLTAFREAAATTAEQLARDPDNPQRIFDHAQSVFWVGYIGYERGEIKEAETQFREYKRLADRMVAIDSKQPEWLMEVSYAQTNLGVLFFEQGRYLEAESSFADGLDKVVSVAALEKRNPARKLEIGTALNWLGRARSALNRTADAIALHRQEIAAYASALKTDPGNTQAQLRAAVAWLHIGQLDELTGNQAAAESAIAASQSIMLRLRKLEPSNLEWQETEIRGLIDQTDNLYFQGKTKQARATHAAANSLLDRSLAADSTNTSWSIGLRTALEVRGAWLALADGNARSAVALAEAAAQRLSSNRSFNSAEAERISLDAAIVRGDALLRLGRRTEASANWQQALTRIPANAVDFQFKILRSRFLLLKRLGRNSDATPIAQRLDRQGYRHPAYLRERSLR